MGFLVTLGAFFAALIIPICGCSDSSERVIADVKVLEINTVRFKTMTGKLPDSLEDFIQQPENYSGRWKPLMNREALRDTWGEPYQYRKPGLKNPNGYDLFSKGPDKTEGTDDDIGNWQ